MQDSENENSYDSVRASKEEIEIVRKTILNHRIDNISPSLNKLVELTDLPKKIIQDCKRQLEKEKLIKTNGNKTYILGGAEIENINHDGNWN